MYVYVWTSIQRETLNEMIFQSCVDRKQNFNGKRYKNQLQTNTHQIKSNQIKSLYDSQENEYISFIQLNQHSSSVSNIQEFIFPFLFIVLRNQTKHNQISTKEIHSFENQINPSNSFSFYSFYFPSKQTENSTKPKLQLKKKKPIFLH